MGKNKVISFLFAMLLLVSTGYAGTERNRNLCDKLASILQGEASEQDRVCDVFVPRNDLASVLEGFTLQPEIGIGLEIEFIPFTRSNNHNGRRTRRLVQGEIALRETEIVFAESFLLANGFEITALHNHYILETPKIIFLHFSKAGNPFKIARTLRDLANSIGNFGTAGENLTPINSLDPVTLNNILGLNGEIKAGGVYRADFQRSFRIRENGTSHEPDGLIAMEGTSALALITGEVPLRPEEVNPFIQAIVSNGLVVSAVHNHELTERPRIFYVHFQQIGFPNVLANAARQALDLISIDRDDQ